MASIGCVVRQMLYSGPDAQPESLSRKTSSYLFYNIERVSRYLLVGGKGYHGTCKRYHSRPASAGANVPSSTRPVVSRKTRMDIPELLMYVF